MLRRLIQRVGSSPAVSAGLLRPTRRQQPGPALARTAASSTLENLASEPALIQAMPGASGTLRAVWDDSVASQYHYLWLRDNCRCASCVDAGTLQKLLDTPTIPLDTRAAEISTLDGGDVHVRWGDGHTSTYSAEWLRDHAEPFLVDGHSNYAPQPAATPSDGVPHLRSGIPQPVSWKAADLRRKEMFIAYSDLMSSDSAVSQQALLDLSNNIRLNGLAFLKGVPLEEDSVLHVAEMVAIPKETCYGSKFDVVQEATRNVSHLAYSGAELDLHTDMNYREKSPGLQFLHCMELNWVKPVDEVPSGRQGLSIFVDGLAVADHLRRNNLPAFHLLSSTPVTFSIRYKEYTYTQQVPIICLGKNEEEVAEVHLNNRNMSPLQLPPNMIMPFYAAYKSFYDCVRSDDFRYTHQLQPGELVIFNNRRVMHGRTAYDPSALERRLQGCYSDLDEFLSKYRSVLRASRSS